MKTIKFFSLLFFCLFFCVSSALLVVAEDAEQATVTEQEQAVTAEAPETAPTGEAKTVVDQIFDFATEHLLDIGFVGWLLYQVLPRVGALAKAKKAKKDFQDTLDHYFDDASNSRSVVNILSAGNESMSKFMGDVAPAVLKLAALLPVAEELVKALRETDGKQQKVLDAMLACRESLLLIGKEYETLMLAAGGATDAEKAKIYAAYASESRRVNEAMAALAAEDSDDTAKESADT